MKTATAQNLGPRQAWVLAQPDYWTAVRFLGRGKYERQERATLAEALVAARELNTEPLRGVLVYAVRQGASAFVSSLDPVRKGRTVISVIIQYTNDKSLKVVQVNHDSDVEKLTADLANDGCTLTRVDKAEDLERFSLPELVRLNNMLSQHQVKGFSTKPKGMARVFDRLSNKTDTPPEGASGETAGGDAGTTESGTAGSNEENTEMAAKSAAQSRAPNGRKPSAAKAREARMTKGQKSGIAKTAAKNAAAKRNAETATRGRASRYTDNMKISIPEEFRKSNPKREGTAAFDNWKLQTKFHGKTVGEARAAGVSSGNLRWSVDHGLMTIK